MTLVDDLADMAWAVHLLGEANCMEVLSASLSLADSWAYMKVVHVVPVHQEAAERSVHKSKEVLASSVIVKEDHGRHDCQLVTEDEKEDLVFDMRSRVSAYTSFQVLVQLKAAWGGVCHPRQH